MFEAVWRGVFGGRWPLKPLRKLWPLAAATAATADLPIHPVYLVVAQLLIDGRNGMPCPYHVRSLAVDVALDPTPSGWWTSLRLIKVFLLKAL